MAVETEENWDQGSELKRAEIQDAAMELAKLHTIFTNDERGKKLLELWRLTANVRVPVNATLDQYARAEAIRSFVQTIEQQINIASRAK